MGICMKDQHNIEQLLRQGIAEPDPRIQVLRRSIEASKEKATHLQSLLPRLDQALWMAHRVEEESHRLDAEEVAKAIDIVTGLVDAAAQRDISDVERILSEGITGLDSVLGVAKAKDH